MRLIIEIDCDNAAFVDNPREAGDILEDLATRLPDNLEFSREIGLYDSNGNRVGECRLVDEADAKPELLKYCEMLLWYYESFRDKSPKGPTELDDIANARAALAKATA